MSQQPVAAWGVGDYKAVVPTEHEIRDAARTLGLADENGDYPRSMRNRIAKAVQLTKGESADAEDPHTGTTAEILARFDLELFTRHIGPNARARILGAAAAHLLETAGLNLETREETTPS